MESDHTDSGLLALLRSWPEAAGILIAVVGYVVAALVFGVPFSVDGYPSKAFRLIESVLSVVLVLSLIAGATRNIAAAPEGEDRFWRRLRWAFWAEFVSAVSTGFVYQLAPLTYDKPGAILGPQVMIFYALASLGLLVTFAILTSALVIRVRRLATRGRLRAIFLDSTAGAIAMATLGLILFLGTAPVSATAARVVMTFGIPVGMFETALLVMALALVPLARARGFRGVTEFCIAAAMLLSVIAIANFLYQIVNPDTVPRAITVTYWILVLAGLASIAERKTWQATASGELELRDAEDRILGANAPVVMAFVLPVIVILAAGAGLRRSAVLAGAVGTSVVASIVLYRLFRTIRENARLLTSVEAERSRAEEFAEEASIQAEIASALLDRATREQEDERIDLALRLHDEFLQGLSAIHVRLRTALRKAETDEGRSRELLALGVDALGDQVDGIRDLMGLLRPPVLEELGLKAALGQILEGCAAAGLEVKFEAEAISPARDEAELALYRIAQEAIANVLTHSASPSIRVKIRERDAGMVLEIEDSGSGFEERGDLELLQEGKVGLASMRRRAEMAGIELEIESSPGDGTRIKAECNGVADRVAAPA